MGFESHQARYQSTGGTYSLADHNYLEQISRFIWEFIAIVWRLILYPEASPYLQAIETGQKKQGNV